MARASWQWTPAASGKYSQGKKAQASGGSFEDEVVSMGKYYAAMKVAKWNKVDPVRIKTRRGIISLDNPFLDFVGTKRGGVPLWFECKSTKAPYLDISGMEKTYGLKQGQKDIMAAQVELGANPFLLWEYRDRDTPLSKVMLIPHAAILARDAHRLNAADWPDIRKGRDILIVEAFESIFP